MLSIEVLIAHLALVVADDPVEWNAGRGQGLVDVDAAIQIDEPRRARVEAIAGVQLRVPLFVDGETDRLCEGGGDIGAPPIAAVLAVAEMGVAEVKKRSCHDKNRYLS